MTLRRFRLVALGRFGPNGARLRHERDG